jgi:hypothetical protein
MAKDAMSIGLAIRRRLWYQPALVEEVRPMHYQENRIQTAYVYSFTVWPDETWDFDKAVFELFRATSIRVEMPFSPENFERFRSGLSHHGLTLREIERVPYAEPETID